MNWHDQSFAGKNFQPRPKYFLSGDKKIFAIITAWGSNSLSAAELFEELETQYNYLSDSEEKTIFVPKMMSLNSLANNIRASVIQVNQKINKEEYTQAFELFFGVLHESVCVFVQIGCPFILLNRKAQDLMLIGQCNKAFISNRNIKDSAPLPNQLLGMYEDISFHPMHYQVSEGDQMIFLNRQLIPKAWWNVDPANRKLNYLSQLATEDSPEMPFCLSFACISEDKCFSQ